VKTLAITNLIHGAMTVLPAAAFLTASAAGAAETAPPASVRDLGAVGDGQADDTQAIQRAADRGGELRFARGVYRLTRTVLIDLDKVGVTSIVADGTATILMAGPGPALKFVGTHAGTADPKSVKDNVWQRQRTPLIDGLEIVGAHPEAIGLWIEGCMQPVITRCTVRQALHGIHLTGRNRNVIIGECHLYHNTGAGLLLERLDLHQINVSNCHISYNAAGGIVVRASSIRNLQIGTCDIEANMAAEGPPAANLLFDTTEGSIREGAIIGCTLQHTHKAPDSANIRFLGRPDPPHKVGFFQIADNTLSDVAVNIELRHARGVTISGNTFGQGSVHNLLAENCSQLVLSGNLLDRNPDYGPQTTGDDLCFVDCRDCTLSGLQIFATAHPEGALILKNCRRFNITGCTILDCNACGILLDQVQSVRIADCLVRDDRPESKEAISLKLVAGQDNMIVNNLFSGRVEIAPHSGRVDGNSNGRP